MQTLPLRHERALLVGMVVLLPALPFLAFGASLSHFFALDDYPQIIQFFPARSISGALASFFSPFPPGNLYRPLVTLVNALLWEAGGGSPFPFHLFNVTMHSLVTLLMFFLLLRLQCRLLVAFLAAAFFAIHPVHTETVANGAGKAELLVAGFGLAALHCGLSFFRSGAGRRRGEYLFACSFCFLLAALSKESGVVIVPICLMCCLFRAPQAGERRERLALLILGLGIALLVALACRSIALNGTLYDVRSVHVIDNPLLELPARGRLVNATVLLGRYAALGIAPLAIKTDYSYAELIPLTTLWDPLTLLYITVLFAIVAALLVGLRPLRTPAFGLAWFFLSFALTANLLFPIGTIFAERLLYLPSLGLLTALAALIGALRSPVVKAGWAALLGALYLSTSLALTPVWKDNNTLHDHLMQVAPHSVRALVNYAVVQRNRKDFEGALAVLDKVESLAPSFAELYYVRSTIKAQHTDLEAARADAETALEIAPAHHGALDVLGRIALAEGDLNGARRTFQQLAAAHPDSHRGQLGLLAVYINAGHLDAAQEISAQLEAIGYDEPEFREIRDSLEKLRDQSKNKNGK